MELFGSKTSPYVRRIRILLDKADYKFHHLLIYEGNDRDVLRSVSPVLKIPVLKDGNQKVYDSRVIFNYLVKKGIHPELTTNQENTLTILDGISDSLIQLYILKNSGINLDKISLYGRINLERVEVSLDEIEKEIEASSFKEWDYLSISLYCLVDWIKFRESYDLSNRTKILDWFGKWDYVEICKETDPRN